MNACPSRRRRSSEMLVLVVIDTLQNPPRDLVSGDAVLLQGIPVTDSDSRILRRLSVNSDTERRANLVLAAVPAADGARLVVEHGEAFPQVGGELFRELGHPVFLDEREDPRLDRRERGMQSNDRAPFLLAGNLLLAIAVHQHGE